MINTDNKKRPLTVRNELRRRAVALWLQGIEISQAAIECDISEGNVIRAINAYRTSGWNAIDIGPSGGGGAPRKIGINEELKIQSLIRNSLPSQFGLTGSNWTRNLVGQLIKKITNVQIDRRSVDACHTRWGLVAPDAYKVALNLEPERAKSWLDNKYVEVIKQAKKEDARVRWILIRELPEVNVIDKGGEFTDRTESQDNVTSQKLPHYMIRLEYGGRQSWRVIATIDKEAITAALNDIVELEKGMWHVIIVNSTTTRIAISEEWLQSMQDRIKILKLFGKFTLNIINRVDEQENNKRSGNVVAIRTESTPEEIIQDFKNKQKIGFNDEESYGLKARVLIYGGLLLIMKSDGIYEEDQYVHLDLRKSWLPSTPFSRQPTPIANEKSMCDLLLICIKEMDRRSSASKSTHMHLMGVARTLIRLYEWSWLQGIFDTTKLTEDHFKKLAHQLGEGGWSNALNIHMRTQQLLVDKTKSEVNSYITRKNSYGNASIRSTFLSELGTNLGPREITTERIELLAIAERETFAKQETRPRAKASSIHGMSSTHLRQEFTGINLLAEIDDPMVLQFHPFPNPKKLADELGRKGNRTPNLTPDKVADLMIASMNQIRNVAPALISLISEYIEAINNKDSSPTKYKFDFARLVGCPSFKVLEDAISMRVKKIYGSEANANEDEISLNSIIYNVYTAAVLVIVFLNARRKDEVQHRKLGIYSGSLRPFDEVLGLYCADFYIEKSYKDYVTFYVSDFTVEAIRVLEELSRLARTWRGVSHTSNAPSPGCDMIIEYPNLAESGRGGPSWFEFDCGHNGRSYKFVLDAIGQISLSEFGLHVGRRAYALIYQYRFEDPSLLALAQQFGASSVERVMTYITDGPDQRGLANAAAYGPPKSAKFQAHLKDLLELEKELDDVAIERVRELVKMIIVNKDQRGGGFSKLLLRFQQKLFGLIKYDLKDNEEQAKKIAEILINRGHKAHPAPHGNCMAAPGRRNVGARCSGDKKGELKREDASLSACTNCTYHDYAAAHIASTSDFLNHQRIQLATYDPESVMGRAMKSSIENTEEWIGIRTNRLNFQKI